MDMTALGRLTARAGRRGALSPLRKVTAAALLLAALTYLALILGTGGSSEAVGLFGPHIALAVAIALTIIAGFRWAPWLAVVAMAVFFIEPLLFARRDLTNAGDLEAFAEIAILLAGLAVGIVAGIATIIENRRAEPARGMPVWLRASALGAAAFALGAILTVAIQQPQTVTGVSPEVLATLPTVTTKNLKYDQSEIQARVGETVALRLVNDDSTTHYFEIDELDVHAVIGPGKTSLAIFKPTQAGSYLIYCGPHSDKHHGTGMVARLIVSQ